MNYDGNFSLWKLLYGLKTDSKEEFKNATHISTRNLTSRERTDFELKMLKRTQYVQYKCSKYNTNNNYNIYATDYGAEIYFPYKNIMYCPIFKSSSTTWIQNLMILWVHQTVRNLKTLLQFFFQNV